MVSENTTNYSGENCNTPSSGENLYQNLLQNSEVKIGTKYATRSSMRGRNLN